MKTLTHELYDQGGNPIPGKLSVAYSWDVLMQDGGVYSSTPKVYYAADGVFSVPILAADDPGIEPGYEAFTTRVSWSAIAQDCNGRMAEQGVSTRTIQVVLADPEPVSIADLDNVTPATMGGVWYGGGGGGGGGVSDHGALTGLADDDHTQYALADGSRGAFAAPLGADDNYVTDAEKAALHSHANKAALDLVSGENTGDQDLSGYALTSSLATVATSGEAADLDATGATDGHVLTADGAGGVAWEAAAGGGSGGTVTADDTPAAPAEGVAASYLVTSAVTWPEGIIWSDDPDSAEPPTITDQALVTLFTVDSTTYAVMAATFGSPPLVDTSDPEWTATLTTGTPTPTTVPVTMSAAATDNADLTYEVSVNSGSTWATIVPSGLTFTISGLTPDTTYPAPQIRVKDSSDNMGPTLTAQGFTTLTAEEITLASAITDLSPVAYWKLNEESGSTFADYSGNGRTATLTGGAAYTLAGQAGPDDNYLLFTTGANAHAQADDADAFSVGASGLTVFLLNWRNAGWAGRRLFEKSAASNAEYHAETSGASPITVTGRLYSPSNNVQQINTTSSSFATGQWRAIAVRYNSNTRADDISLFVDSGTPQAAPQGTLGNTQAYANGTAPFVIGHTNLSIGAFAHVAVFPTALTNEQIGTIMAAAADEGWIA